MRSNNNNTMKKDIKFPLITLFLATGILAAQAQTDYTDHIVNPSFETGDMTGWTSYGYNGENPEGERLVTVTPASQPNDTDPWTMSNSDGERLCDYYLWAWTGWWSYYNIHQTISNLPAGTYELSAVVASHSTLDDSGNQMRYVSLFAGLPGGEMNDKYSSIYKHTKSVEAQGREIGIPVSMKFTLDSPSDIIIGAGLIEAKSVWEVFFKADGFHLTYYGQPLSAAALPLPNDNTTMLTAGQWYYFDVPAACNYFLFGNLASIEYTTNGNQFTESISTSPVSPCMNLNPGRIYLKPSESTTLLIAPERELQQTRFTACALNVDGLPQKVAFVTLNEDGPGSEGSKLISQYLSQKSYDFMGFSEDFNYHGSLMTALSNQYSSGTVRATLSLTDLSIPFDTDGLNLIWKNSTTTATNESWTRWTSTTNTDGNQYVKKGFRHYDVTLTDGTLIDVFILHMDAGDVPDSRNGQWMQLANAISNNYNNNRPKIILGDTNSRWTREDMRTNFLNILNSTYDISDAWVEHWRGGVYPTTDMADLTDQSDPSDFSKYEVVDKIIYLNPKTSDSAQLKALNFKLEQDYTYDTINHDGNTQQLGDHRPAVAEFVCGKVGPIVLIIGDVNKDGQISIADVTALVNIILGKDNTQPYQYDHLAADVNQDGNISIADVTALVNIILGKN